MGTIAADKFPMSGIAEVQARIQEIMARFDAPAAAAPVRAAGDSSFSATLARVREGASISAADGTGSTGAPAPTGELNRAGVEPVQWANDLLSRLGMPRTAENVKAIVAWQQAEGTRARFNPLATCQGYPNATQFNSVGVKNYATYTDGLVATIKALRNGRYGNVLAALQRGTSATAVAQAIADSPWGSGEMVLKVLASGR